MKQPYSKFLTDILVAIGVDYVGENPLISSLVVDSRKLEAGGVFIATKGLSVDARDYIKTLNSSEMVAVIYESEGLSVSQKQAIDKLHMPAVAVSGLSKKVGYLASEFYDSPSDDLSVYGITGTNGKTSCAYFLTQCFEGLGFKTAFMGTIGYGDIDNLQQSSHTTMDAVNLQKVLADLRDNNFTHVCMEVSSHSLDQARVLGTNFYAVMLTNLSHDHLDYHGDMQQYAFAKSRLFKDFSSKFSIVNQRYIDQLLAKEAINSEFVVSYGVDGDVDGVDVVTNSEGLQLHIETESIDFSVSVNLIGKINVPNVLLVVSCLLALGVSVEEIQQQLTKLKAPAGRMELFHISGKPTVVVDYAHTPDALKLALESLREHCLGKLWCVFGCGGDRDIEKRNLMGAVAEISADHIVLTNDNPRSEAPKSIIGQILKGMNDASKAVVVESREQAIQWAVNHAEPNDWVLIAGKGHEEYQIIGEQKHVFSDRAWVAECLEVAA